MTETMTTVSEFTVCRTVDGPLEFLGEICEI